MISRLSETTTQTRQRLSPRFSCAATLVHFVYLLRTVLMMASPGYFISAHSTNFMSGRWSQRGSTMMFRCHHDDSSSCRLYMSSTSAAMSPSATHGGGTQFNKRPSKHRQNKNNKQQARPLDGSSICSSSTRIPPQLKRRHDDNSSKNNNNSNLKRRRRRKRQLNIAFNKALQDLVQRNHHRGLSAVQEAEDFLLAQLDAQNNNSNSNTTTTTTPTTTPPYDTVSFNIILQAWARQHSLPAAQAADRLLAYMLQNQRQLHIQPDSYSYAAVLHAYAKSGGKVPAARRAEELLQQWWQSQQQQQHTSSTTATTTITDVCHNAVMDAWAASGDERAGERAEVLLRQLQSRATRISYNACIKAYARTGRALDAQRLLRQVQNPDKISYTSCMDAWSKCTNSVNAAEQAELLLQELEQAWVGTGNVRLRPDVMAYTAVLTAYARSGQATAAAGKAHELLDRMQVHAAERPNAAFLNAWINLLSKTSSISQLEAISRSRIADEMLTYMQSEYKRGNAAMRPCVITYTAVISVLAHAGTSFSADRAEELLKELETLWRTTGELCYLPNAKTFASVLNVLARSGAMDSLQRADKLLERMTQLYKETQAEDLRPNLVVYAQMFQVLANCGDVDAATHAKELLEAMNEQHKAGVPDVQPDAATYAYLINTFTKSGVKNAVELASHVLKEVEEGYQAGNGKLKPTELLYSAVLQAYAKSASKQGADLAEKLLERTKTMYREGKLYAKPTALHYNAVMDALARAHGGREAALRTEELLDEMESRGRAGDPSLLPKTRSFNAAILAWKNSHADEAPERAEALLRRLNDRYKAGDTECRPCRVTVNSVIAAWAKSKREGAAERANQYLRFMLETSLVDGDASEVDRSEKEGLMPDAFSFNSCIDAYARSCQSDAAEKATEVFEKMLELYQQSGNENIKPDVITLTSLRNAWSKDPKAKDKVGRVGRARELLREAECSRKERQSH